MIETKIYLILLSYNRPQYLSKVLLSVYEQTFKSFNLIIVDNNSSFDIDEYLKKCDFISFRSDINLELVRLDNNVGSSGGFSYGAGLAFLQGASHLMFIDDDILLEENCLAELLKYNYDIMMPVRFFRQNCVELMSLDSKFQNPFYIDFKRKMVKDYFHERQYLNYFQIQTLSFEGLFINRSVVEKCGLPVNNFFICHDDLEYSLRFKKYGYSFYMITSARINRLFPVDRLGTVLSWKSFYAIRNFTCLHRMYSKNIFWFMRPLAISIILFIYGILKLKFSESLNVIKGFVTGIYFKANVPSLNKI